ncbi:unnamed protein product [Microthlaspi erraticum]|uniref:Translation elongation factor EF1B beta/delta subunit guanine nucleotide exchange domain-containing protein n=1 Tax=Microthlaspi erraticum TaxID=1685480 RepID=A0A6D2IKQ5_9BRAS|nr:unnamed protein product [Microthlaspi erraticum]
MAAFPNLNSDAGLKKLDEHLLTRYYITSHKASKDDIKVYAALSKPPPPQYVNASRWYNHIETLLSISGISSEGSGVTIDGLASIKEEVVADSKWHSIDGKVVVFDDEQDVDLIMEEAEEEKRAASLKASSEKKESWESAVIIIIPTDAETDMKKLEKDLRSIQMEEGLFWGASKRVPIGYGHELLRIVATVPHNEEFDILGILVDDHISKLGRFNIHTAGLDESLLLIKPNDDEADMKKLEEVVRSIQARGLFWGASRLVPVGCGIKLLGIECTAVGPLIRPGRLVRFEDIVKEEIVGHHYVQSCQALSLDRICNGITSEEESDSKDDAALFGEERAVSLKESGKSGLMIVNMSLLNPDMKKSEESVRSSQKEGVVWEASKIIKCWLWIQVFADDIHHC